MNLENILNKELDEGVFSAANDIKGGIERGINSVKKGISNAKDKEKRDLESSIAKNDSKKQSQEQNNNNNGDSQVINHIKKIKKKLFVALVNAVRAYEATDGENNQEKSNSKQFRRAKTEADAQYAAMKKTYENQKAKNPKFGLIPRDWTNLVKRLNNLSKKVDNTKEKLNKISSAIGYKAPFTEQQPNKTTNKEQNNKTTNKEQNNKTGIDKYTDEEKLNWTNITTDPELVKYYMDNKEAMNRIPLKNRKVIPGLSKYYSIFGNTKTAKPLGESMIDEFLNTLSEDVDTFEMAKQIMTNFYNGAAEGIALRRYMAEQAVEAFARYIESMSDETKQAELKKLMEPKKEKSKEEKPVDNSKLDTKVKEIAHSLGEMGFNKDLAKAILNGLKEINSDMLLKQEGEALRIGIMLASPGGVAKINDTEYTIDDGKLVMVKSDINDSMLNKLFNKLNENVSVNADAEAVIKKLPTILDKIKDIKNDDKDDKPRNKNKETAGIIKRKITAIIDKYEEAEGKGELGDYKIAMNKALRTLGIKVNSKEKDSDKFNATRLIGWLKAAQAGSLKVESMSSDFELELYKEDIIDIMWDKLYLL